MKRGYLAVAVVSMAVGMTVSAVAAWAMPPWEGTPFFGESAGTSVISGPPIGQLIPSESTGTFQSNHLGSGTYTAETTQNYPRHIESGMENAMGQCAFVDGTIELVAANGDVLNVDVDADRSVNCAPPGQPPSGAAPGDVYTSTLVGEIVGGTGRFEDATGFIFSEGTSTIQDDGSTVDEADIFGEITY